MSREPKGEVTNQKKSIAVVRPEPIGNALTSYELEPGENSLTHCPKRKRSSSNANSPHRRADALENSCAGTKDGPRERCPFNLAR